MPESIADQIIDAIVQLFADIDSDNGTNFWYRPTKVSRIRTWKEAHFDATQKHLVFIRPGIERHYEEASSGWMRGELGLFVLVGRQHGLSATEAGGAPQPWTIGERCKRDLLKRLLLWRSLGVPFVYNIMTDEGLEVQHFEEALLPAWALLELHFTALYRYNRVSP